jgi:hypothetical protein
MSNSLNVTTSDPIRTPWPCKYCHSDLVVYELPKPNKNGEITNKGALRCAPCGKGHRFINGDQFTAIVLNGNGGQN